MSDSIFCDFIPDALPCTAYILSLYINMYTFEFSCYFNKKLDEKYDK